MKYCMQCGARLRMKEHETEGHPVPWCDACGDYRFPVFNAAVSMVTFSADRHRVLLIRQYGRPFWILPAGYINKGEDAEDAVRRELGEELGLNVQSLCFNRSRYFPPSNTLLLNFAVAVEQGDPRPNWEVDDWRWFTVDEARENIKPQSYAQAFLLHYLDHRKADTP
ncbi:MAG: NUDIX domain-containing protein [Clostridia bacterium]|nr:NUDIX domain-containing protein [Clostridia bacterium]